MPPPQSPGEDLFEDIDALSDEEAKEELREAAQQRMLEASQVGKHTCCGTHAGCCMHLY